MTDDLVDVDAHGDEPRYCECDELVVGGRRLPCPPGHCCDYVEQRNRLIPTAVKIANKRIGERIYGGRFKVSTTNQTMLDFVALSSAMLFLLFSPVALSARRRTKPGVAATAIHYRSTAFKALALLPHSGELKNLPRDRASVAD
jgi:hypothetical protein